MKNITRPRNLLLAIILAIFSCTSDKRIDNQDFKEPSMKPIYFGTGCQGDSCSYTHYLQLSFYDDSQFNEYDFINLADKYLDSVKTHLPVSSIEFCRPFEFHNIGGSENDEQLTNNAIVSIYYYWPSKQEKVPEIYSVSIWNKGQRKDLREISLKSRRQTMKYYNSKK